MGRHDLTMIRNVLMIGRWSVEFYFCPDGYDVDELLDRLYSLGASAGVLREAMSLMESGRPNTGFTFPNPYEYEAIVAVGPTTSGDEFVNTFTHEIHHLAGAIAGALGVDLEGETPAYIAGDSARELASVVCRLGCSHCG